jgi:hypothetical protein
MLDCSDVVFIITNIQTLPHLYKLRNKGVREIKGSVLIKISQVNIFQATFFKQLFSTFDPTPQPTKPVKTLDSK